MAAQLRRLVYSLFVITLLAATPRAARAQTQTDIDFESLDGGVTATVPMPAGYAGFDWQGLDVAIRPQGFGKPWIAYGTLGNVSAVTRAGVGYADMARTQHFDLVSACISPTLDDTELVTVQGWRAGVLVYAQTVTAYGMVLMGFEFDFNDIDEVRFLPQAGPVVLDEIWYADRVPADVVPPTIALDPLPVAPVAFTEVTVSGTVTDAGAAVAGYAGSAQVAGQSYPFQVDAQGRFAVTVPLAEGDNAILVQVVDGAGNIGSVQVDVVRDTVKPVVTVVAPTDGAVVVASALNVLASVSDASPTTVRVDLVSASGAVVSSGPASFAGGLATASVAAPGEGPYTVVVVATDAAGNQGQASAGFVWDLSGPAVSVDVPASARFGPLPGNLLPFSVTVVDVAPATLTASFAPAVAIPAGGLTVPLLAPLADGLNQIALQVVDAGGRERDLSFTVVYDTVPPTASFVSPSAGAFVRGAIEVALSASDDSGIASVSFSVDGGPSVTASGSGPYAATLDLTGLADGVHVVRALVADGVGNLATPQLAFVVDTTPPAVALSGPPAGSYITGTVTVGATATDAGSGVASVEVRANGVVVASCAGGAPCNATVDTTRLPDGPFELTAVAVDQVGNASAPASLALVADNRLPARFIVSPAPGAVVSGTIRVAISIAAPDFASVVCTAGGVSLGRSTDPNAAWSFDTRRGLDGPLSIACTAATTGGSLTTETVDVTVRNWSLWFLPSWIYRSARHCGEDDVTLRVEGANVALLAPLAQAGALAVAVPGGTPVKVEARRWDRRLHDRDRDGLPELSLRVDRKALVASLSGAIATRALAATGPVTVTLVSSDGRRLGTARLEVR
jgi:hypothetical protein